MRRVATALALIALAAVTALAGVDSVPSGLAAAQTTPTYANGNSLIDVDSLAKLNAIRYDLNGNGAADSMTNAAAYATAFPNPTANMGCPSSGCNGYELTADLDFDTDDDGVVNSSDTYPNWTPIGSFTSRFAATFQGNNKTISNLTINSSTGGTAPTFGLFGGVSGELRGVGLIDADVRASATGNVFLAALAGLNSGTIRSSYATGAVAQTGTGLFGNAGGLVAYNSSGTIAASWAAVNVSVAASNARVGGLAGRNESGATIIASYAAGAVAASNSAVRIGGLAGNNSGNSSISTSYAAGPVSSTGTASSVGGLAGVNSGNSSITASYWDTGTTGIADDANSDAPEGVATSDLQSITSYTGVFANWNVNVDGQTGVDDPWEFGTGMQYPRLKFGFDTGGQVAQGSLVMGTPGTNGDNPVVGQVARVCLLAGPTQRAAGTGGATYQPWQWYRSTDGVSWGSPIAKTGPTYDYMPVAGDAGNYLRACVDVVSSAGAERVLGDDRVCVGPFAKVRAN